MSIAVTCACGKKLLVKDELAGKLGKCPACGSTLVIPSPAATPLTSPPPTAPNVVRPSPVAPAVTAPALPAPLEPKPKSDPFLCPRCGATMEKTLTLKKLLPQLFLGLTAGFYFAPKSPFKCPRCGPIQYNELSPAESHRAQEVISAKGCFKLGCAVVLGSLVLTFVVGYVLQLFGVKLK